MQRPCAICGIIIQNGERVAGVFSWIYQNIPSDTAFRVHRDALAFVPGTIRHYNCLKEGTND